MVHFAEPIVAEKTLNGASYLRHSHRKDMFYANASKIADFLKALLSGRRLDCHRTTRNRAARSRSPLISSGPADF